jgi:hypothetical protein
LGRFSEGAEKLEKLRESGFEGPIDQNGEPVMSRTDSGGKPLPLFKGGDGHGTKDDRDKKG